jgi:hypothetical protein
MSKEESLSDKLLEERKRKEEEMFKGGLSLEDGISIQN